MAAYPYGTSTKHSHIAYAPIYGLWLSASRDQREKQRISVVTLMFYFGNTNICETNMYKFKICSIWVVGTQIFLYIFEIL